MKDHHPSINCCTYGVDIMVSTKETGRVWILSLSWDELEKMAREQGKEVTGQMIETVDRFTRVSRKT